MDNNVILYTTDSESVSVQVHYEDGTFWLTQKRMAELFGVDVRTLLSFKRDFSERRIIKRMQLSEKFG